MGADVNITTPGSWHLKWLLQEADVQFLGIETMSQVKQSMRWVQCIGPEGQRRRLWPYVANIAVNQRDYDLLQQWKTQINIPAVSEVEHKPTHVSEKDIIRYYKKQSPTLQALQKHKTISKL